MANSTARPVAIKISEDFKARVKRLADARQRTPPWLMREAITQFVEREEKREMFHQDTLKAGKTKCPSKSELVLLPEFRKNVVQVSLQG